MKIMDMLLVLHNNAVYCLAVIIILSLFIKRRFASYLFSFLLIMASGLIWTLTERSHLTMPVAICLLTVFYAIPNNNLLQTFRQCLTAIFLTWCFITPLSCVIMVLVPQWHNGPGCNLLTGVTLTMYAFSVRLVPGMRKHLRVLAQNRYAIMLELLVLSFFTLILPQYFPIFSIESKRQIGLFTLAFFILLAFIGFLIYKIQEADRQHQQLQAYVERQRQYREQTRYQFETLIALRHYYFKLYQSMAPLVREQNMEGLKAYFERYITNIHQESISEQGRLASIQSEVVRNLLDVTVSRVKSLDGTVLELAVEGIIVFPDELEMDVFEIVCNLLDNAMRELEGQNPGLLRVILRYDGEVTAITVANTLHKPINIEEFYKKKWDGGGQHGYGLNRIRDIVHSHPAMEQLTYIGGMYGKKEILVQKIKISEVIR